jgi:type I restriction enzyme, S subunit
MNNEIILLLEKYFDVAFAAPDGVKKLRELILSLAMQGKLVPQDPSDQSASELLKEIEAEKSRLVKDGKIKPSKPLPEIKPDEVPFDLPRSWEWVRLDNICSYIQRGKSPVYVDKSDFPVIAQKCIQWHGLEIEKAKFICPESVKKYAEERFLATEDLLWNSTGLGTLGRVGRYIHEENVYKKVVADSHVTVIRPMSVDSQFIYFWISSDFVQRDIENKSAGSTKQIELPTSTIKKHIIPLPPIAEQRRIVAKIDELMARCDELEKLRQVHTQKQITVHNAALNQLLTAKDHNDFKTSWHFITQHFGELYSVKANVTELRKAILQLAVMGKIVPQDPNDQPASELLNAIEAEKIRLVKDGKIKPSKPLPEIKPDEVPYDLPKGWEWIRLQEVLDVRDGTHDSPKDAIAGERYPLITSKNFTNGEIDFSNARQISAKDYFEISKRSKVDRLDILFSMIGGNIGNQVLVQDEREFSIKNVALFKYYNRELTYPYFFKRYMEQIANYLQQKATGGAQPFVSLGFLRNLVMALPPISEQHRIVAKIDQLMTLCDELEKQIDIANSKKTNLLNSVMTKV